MKKPFKASGGYSKKLITMTVEVPDVTLVGENNKTYNFNLADILDISDASKNFKVIVVRVAHGHPTYKAPIESEPFKKLIIQKSIKGIFNPAGDEKVIALTVHREDFGFTKELKQLQQMVANLSFTEIKDGDEQACLDEANTAFVNYLNSSPIATFATTLDDETEGDEEGDGEPDTVGGGGVLLPGT
ncbi:hypothetical protein ACG2LH_04210 [Zhouia sp. PK063]|uniref:hypothetical protein n=1 Tax=Zhouia sp. PK063 TaxID=3373602 RepID=UPI003796D5B8